MANPSQDLLQSLQTVILGFYCCDNEGTWNYTSMEVARLYNQLSIQILAFLQKTNTLNNEVHIFLALEDKEFNYMNIV